MKAADVITVPNLCCRIISMSDLELHFLPDNKLLVCVNSYVQTPSYRKWVAGGCDTEPLVPNTESVEIQNSSLRRIASPARQTK